MLPPICSESFPSKVRNLFVPLSKTGAELLFETFSQRYERASTPVTHHVHILEMNGDSFRLMQSRRKRSPNS